MHPLDNPVRDYAWGSTTALAALAGREPTGAPEAELWMGAHPSGPSRVPSATGSILGLDAFIARDPGRSLGPAVASRFEDRLPFLFKVLAAAEPLSLQAHPSREQAERGYAAEEAAGIPLSAGHRVFKDRNHKPELLCAVDDFEALCGFAPLEVTIDRFERLAIGEVAEIVERLKADDLRAAFAWTMRRPVDSRARFVDRVVAAAEGIDDASLGWAIRLAERYPADVGVVASLFLNVVALAPGDAIFLPAGNLHAYLRGVGVELMANSDNVLRGGLTPKHVDADALLEILRFEPQPIEPIRAESIGDGQLRWSTPAAEFELRGCELEPGECASIDVNGPEIVLCLRGAVRLHAGEHELDLGPLGSAFIEHADAHYEVAAREPSMVFRAIVPAQSAATR